MADGKKDKGTAVFMISVAAELSGLHPQTLRIYEQKGLITPARTPKNTRLYSEEDVERLRYIQRLTSDMGMNLAGVEKVLELEERIEKMKSRIEGLRQDMNMATRQLKKEVEAVHKSYRRELIPLPKNEIILKVRKHP